MKKNKMMRIASVLLVAALLSTCAISGTFAKYIDTASGDATAQVAKWDVAVVAKGEDSFAFDLFETILDTDGNAEADVAAGKIAPGTKGQFTIALNSNSEVTTDCKIDFTVTNAAGVPIEFSTDGASWDDDLADITKTIAVNEAYSEEITVYWQWAIGDTTGADNAYGDGATSVTVAVDVTFEQVD